ncbi:MAG: flagellar motor switch phosphatase FliY [Alicyclobacillus sp.]|nr:flagellar motor switch phosphatase FliY [Alicyclobacillus sp.]
MPENAKLSQAEIDALLNHSGGLPSFEPQTLLSDDEKDVLGEVGNISFGAAATSLSALLRQRVEITTPQVSVLDLSQLKQEVRKPCVLVSVDYTEGLKGSNALAIDLEDAKTIADLMLGGNGQNVAGELNDLHLSAVAEAMNQMTGGAATAMSTIFGRSINISPPKVTVVDLSTEAPFDFGLSDGIVKIAFKLRIGQLIDSQFMQLIPIGFARTMIELLKVSHPTAQEAGSDNRQFQGDSTTSLTQPTSMNDAAPSPATARAGRASGGVDVSRGTNTHGRFEVNPLSQVVRKPEFMEFEGAGLPVSGPPRNLALLFDVPLTVTVELGRTKRIIKDILDLAPGSILELDKLAGEPVDILVNNRKIAVGEVVVVEENFGVRVTDIISPSDRVKNLQ